MEHRQGRNRSREVLIELLGSIGFEGLPPAAAAASQRRFDNHGFRRGSGWSDENFEALLTALAQIPDAHITPVDGLRFNRMAAHSDPRRGGDYDPQTHTITMYDRIFSGSLTRFGTPGAGSSTEATRAIAHEIGHAVDLQPLRATWASLEREHAVRNAAFSQYEAPPGSGNYRFPATEQASWNRLSNAIRAAEQRRDRARSASGSRWQNAGGVFETVEGSRAAGSSGFRQAAIRDGGTRVTRYSDTDWGEYFADSYSLYITAESTLRRLRPNVHAWFSANYPK